MTDPKLQEMLETLENGNISDFKAWLSGLHPFEAAVVGMAVLGSARKAALVTMWADVVERDRVAEKSR